MIQEGKSLSLREQILAAESDDAIKALLELGAGHQYRFASSKTQSRWISAARKRRKELKGAQ